MSGPVNTCAAVASFQAPNGRAQQVCQKPPAHHGEPHYCDGAVWTSEPDDFIGPTINALAIDANEVRLSDLETQLRCKEDAIRVLTDANARLQVELARALGTIQRGSR